ncbi:CaiB/BaiF CoA transferase family protein (plasmid) [Nocardioides sp. R1-1]|uniref:CaiB/BaiF CoA transferase family protein n=1 Tax=Nocardioides sp. R1-1 TaxID=3383502 RepID=UPI0038D1E8CF
MADPHASHVPDDAKPEAGPLHGVTVIDLTRALAGPTCTALLGDLGADVIKVEGLPGGDGARSWAPFEGDESLYFASVNRNKTSLALTLRDPRALEVLDRLLATADVLVENFRPGTLAAMGLAPDILRRKFPRLVIASISGFGSRGPEQSTPGLDQVAQGMSGLMSLTGPDSAHPTRVGVPIIDSITGVMAALAISAALAGRGRTGHGSHVETSLLETGINMLSFQAQRYLSLGEVPSGHGNDHPVIWPYGTFRTAREEINIAAGNEPQWRALCQVLGEPELADRPEFSNGRDRLARREELRAEIERLLSVRDARDWIPDLRDAGIPAGPVHRLDEVFADPQVMALDMVQEVTSGAGSPLPLVRGPITVDGNIPEIRLSPPSLGRDSEDILRATGLSEGEIEELVRAGVVGPG